MEVTLPWGTLGYETCSHLGAKAGTKRESDLLQRVVKILVLSFSVHTALKIESYYISDNFLLANYIFHERTLLCQNSLNRGQTSSV